MKKVKVLIVIGIMSLLSGCSQPPCTSIKGHEWGKWKNAWKKLNDFGGMRQSRECQKCGLIETEIHK